MSKYETELTPEELENLHLGKPKEFAAGSGAVINSMKHIIRESGIVHGTKVLTAINQKGGFDCPSCAWPDPDDHRAITEFCENGAKAIASETTKKRIDRAFFRKYSIEDLGRKSDHWHELQGRLTEPMVLKENATHYEPISWEDSYALIAEEMDKLNSPDDAIFYTSGRASNEAAFAYQLFCREFGTNNLPDCSNMCHESSGAALNATIGIGKGTVKLEDFDHADAVLVIGQNPGTNHPRMLSALQSCVRNGGKVISINPLKEAGLLGFAHPQEVGGIVNKFTPLSSIYLQVKQNGDHALLKGIAKILIDNDLFDQAYIDTNCKDFADYKASIEAENWDELVRISGIAKEEIEKLALLLGSTKKIITCWAMGLTQHKNAVATIKEVVNIHLLRGALGIESGGLCPVRGHSNVQGDRTMGVFEKMPEDFLKKLQKVFNFNVPRKDGMDTVDSIKAMHEEVGKVFIALGGNFLSATPDTSYTAKALRNCSLTVQISTKLNRSHIVTGKQALILPCLGRSELDYGDSGKIQFITVENSMGVVHSSTGKFAPASEYLKGEPRIVSEMAEAVLNGESHAQWKKWAGNYNAIRDAIESVIPGFENFNSRIKKPGGFYLPNHARIGDFAPVGGTVPFSISPIEELKLEEGQLILMTIRSHDQFNTTIYGMDDRYRGIYKERRVILMNGEDMEERGISHEQPIDIISYFEGEERKAPLFLALKYDMPRGCAAAYFPEANVLVPINSKATESHTPTSKGVIIRVFPHGKNS